MDRAAAVRARSVPVTIPIQGVIGHNGAGIAESQPVVITTPPERWAYAAEFPFATAQGERPGGRIVVRVAVKVNSGVAGIGCLNDDGQHLVERQLGSLYPFEYVDLAVEDGQCCKSILVRNALSSGQASRVEIRSIIAAPAEWAEQRTLEIVVDDSAFSRFRPWSGVTPAGYWTDWLGIHTRADVWAFGPEDMAIYNRERQESPKLPTEREHVLDWIPLLDAVSASRDTFVMTALGAGWGRWLSAGAFAARQLGLDYRLFGVEAEPTHFAWMERHFTENGLDPQRYAILQAAASGAEGTCWFQVGNAAAWYGQSITSGSGVDVADNASASVGSEIEVDNRRLRKVRCLDLRAVVRDLPIVDYMHMDIQGAEADFLGAHPDLLDARVRMVNVGTHLVEIEEYLRRLFSRLGWRCLYDVPLGTAASVKVGVRQPNHMEFGDGVQVWRNEGRLA